MNYYNLIVVVRQVHHLYSICLAFSPFFKLDDHAIIHDGLFFTFSVRCEYPFILSYTIIKILYNLTTLQYTTMISFNQQWVYEVCFPTGTYTQNDGSDIQFMFDLLHEIETNNIPAPAPIEQRWSASSSSLMSPAYSPNRNDLFCWVGYVLLVFVFFYIMILLLLVLVLVFLIYRTRRVCLLI